MALLLASLMVYGRMANDNEITALQASGYSALQLLVPVLITGAALTTLLLWWGERIAPKGLRVLQAVASDILRDTATAGIRSGSFNELGPFVIFPRSVEEGKMRSLRMFEVKDNKVSAVVSAPTGSITYTPEQEIITLNVNSGMLVKLLSDERDMAVQFDEMTFSIGLPNLLHHLARGGRLEQQYSRRELNQKIEDYRGGYLRKNDFSSREIKWFYEKWKECEIEKERRISQPFACLIMGIIGALLGMESRMGKRSACYSLTIAVIFIYFIVLSFTKTYAEEGALSAFTAMWIPNILGLAATVYLLWRTRRV